MYLSVDNKQASTEAMTSDHKGWSKLNLNQEGCTQLHYKKMMSEPFQQYDETVAGLSRQVLHRQTKTQLTQQFAAFTDKLKTESSEPQRQ